MAPMFPGIRPAGDSGTVECQQIRVKKSGTSGGGWGYTGSIGEDKMEIPAKMEMPV